MSDPKKAYIVTSGDYSDYHIVAVFTDHEKAEHFLGVYNSSTHWASSQAEIEEYTIGDDAVDVSTKEVLVELSMFPTDDAVITYHLGENVFCRLDKDELIERDYPARHKLAGQKYPVFRFMLDVGEDEWGVDDEKIRKIAYDRFAQFKAAQAGI